MADSPLPLLYITIPKVVGAPDNGERAWFAQWSSGHLSHANQAVANYARINKIPFVEQEMGWEEYQRLLRESHWYDRP